MIRRLLLAAGLFLSCQAQPAMTDIDLPTGFHLEVYARVPGARQLSVAPDGTLFVGTLADSVYAVTARRKVIKLIDGLSFPNGVAFADGTLYIGEIERLSRIQNVLSKLDQEPTPETLNDSLPGDRLHGYRVLAFGPDQRLYIAMGAPTNVGEVALPHATISRFSKDFRSLETVARGIRNSVGFDWHPADGVLWFTDNGRDMLGDDLPPEELNRAPRSGLHFGFPYRYGNNQPDPLLGSKAPAGLTFTPPAATMQAHMAPLGMRFYTGKMFPASYRNCIFLACHGSWNRSSKVGYKVMLARPDDAGHARVEDFATGWLRNGRVSGRPVDVQQLPDGSLAISDDHAGVIYRLTYK